jgi:CMP/dCMP kinase
MSVFTRLSGTEGIACQTDELRCDANRKRRCATLVSAKIAGFMKKAIITLSGDIGSGKSAVGKLLSELTGFELLSTGSIQRSIATKLGITTLELNERSAKDRSVDDQIDQGTIELGKTRDRFIMDSRLAWHFIPQAFKVFLTVSPRIAGERVFNAARAEEKHSSVEAAIENNLSRQKLEQERFGNLYGVELRNHKNYDLVVDTSTITPEEVAQRIYSAYKASRDA